MIDVLFEFPRWLAGLLPLTGEPSLSGALLNIDALLQVLSLLDTP